MDTGSKSWLCGLLAMTLVTPAAWAQAPGATAAPTPHGEVKQDRGEARRDRRQLRRDRREVRRNRGTIRGDRREIRADRKDIAGARSRLRADRAAGNDAAVQADH